ncbi:MAG: PQQ-binding-like beta-propeller repeat protein [Acidimicrobiales bacterium]
MAVVRIWLIVVLAFVAACSAGEPTGDAEAQTEATSGTPTSGASASSTPTSTTSSSIATPSTDAPPPEDPIECEPIALGGGGAAAGTGTAELRDLDGPLRWMAEIDGSPTAAILHAGSALIASEDRFVVLDRTSCEVVFTTNHNGGSLSENRLLFLTDHDLRMVSTMTGELLWTREVAGAFSYATTDEFALLITGTQLQLIDPDTGDREAGFDLTGPHRGFRVVDDTAYIFGEGGLAAFSVADGRRWLIDDLGSINAVYADNRHVMVDLDGGGFAFLDAATGETTGTGGPAAPTFDDFPVFDDDLVIRYDSNGFLRQLAYDGQELDSVAIGQFGTKAFHRAGIVVARRSDDSTEWTIWGTELKPVATFDAPVDALVGLDQESVLIVHTP